MTLLEDIGGEAAVTKVVDVFYTNLLKDDRVAPFFAKTNMDRQRTMQTKFLMHVTGGTPYNGASMRKAHSRMRLTDEHFNVVLSTLAAALRECGVADVHIAQIAAVAETTRDDVLGRTPATDE